MRAKVGVFKGLRKKLPDPDSVRCLTAEQQKYAAHRVRTELKAKLSQIRQRHAATATLSAAEMLDAILDRDAVLRPDATLSTALADAFDFSRVQADVSMATPGSELALDLAAMELRATNILDEVMLGDAATALRLVRTFCDGEAE